MQYHEKSRASASGMHCNLRRLWLTTRRCSGQIFSTAFVAAAGALRVSVDVLSCHGTMQPRCFRGSCDPYSEVRVSGTLQPLLWCRGGERTRCRSHWVPIGKPWSADRALGFAGSCVQCFQVVDAWYGTYRRSSWAPVDAKLGPKPCVKAVHRVRRLQVRRGGFSTWRDCDVEPNANRARVHADPPAQTLDASESESTWGHALWMLRSQLFRARVRLLGRYVSASWLAAYVLLFIWLVSPHFPAALRLERPVQLGILLLLIADVAWGLGWLFRGGGSKPYEPLVQPSELDWKCTLGEYFPARSRAQHGFSLAFWWFTQTINNGALWLLCALNAMSWAGAPIASQLAEKIASDRVAGSRYGGALPQLVQVLAWHGMSASVLTLTFASLALVLLTALLVHPTTRYGTSTGVVSRAAFGHRGGRLIFCCTRILIAMLIYSITSAFGAACLAEAFAGMSPLLTALARHCPPWLSTVRVEPAIARSTGKLVFYVLQLVLLSQSGPLARQQTLMTLTPYSEEPPLWGLFRLTPQQDARSAQTTLSVPRYARNVGRAVILSRTVAPVLWLSGSFIAASGLVPGLVASLPATGWNRSVWSGVLERAAAYGVFDPSMMLPLTCLVGSALALPIVTYGDVAKGAKDQTHQLMGVALGVVPTIFAMSYLSQLFWGASTLDSLERLFAPSTLIADAFAWTRPAAALCFAGAVLLSNNAVHLMPARRSLEKFFGHGLLTRAITAVLAIGATSLAASSLGVTLFLGATGLRRIVLPVMGALAGTLTGIILADYFLLRRTSLRFLDLYREWNSTYWYDIRGKGENEVAYFAYKLTLGIAAIGLTQFLGAQLLSTMLDHLAQVHAFFLRWFSAAIAYSITRFLQRLASMLLRRQLSWVDAAWRCAFLFSFVFSGGCYYLICFMQRRWHIPFAALLRIIFLGSPFPYHENDSTERTGKSAKRLPAE